MKLYKHSICILLLATLAIMSCEDKETPATSGLVDLDFYAVYDDQPLVMLDFYPYAFDENINFGTSDFYFSDCYLSDNNGNTQQLVDIELIDFTNQNKDLTGALAPISVSDIAIEPGKYTSLTFSVGVNEALNATRPEEYTPDNPLSLAGHYWTAWDSYIFAKFQGQLTKQDSADVSWLFHTGKDDVFRTFTYPIDLEVDGNESTISLTLDHKQLFVLESDSYMDIRSKPTNHNPQDLEPLIQITENMEHAISITIE